MTKPDLVALAERLEFAAQNTEGCLYSQRKMLTEAAQALRHLASQPSLYEAGLRDMRERAAQWHRDQHEGGHCGESTSEIIIRQRRNKWHEQAAVAIAALPADGGGRPLSQDEHEAVQGALIASSELAHDIQSSDGGVEGHAGLDHHAGTAREAPGLTTGRLASPAQVDVAGIKPGPSEATPSTAGSVREALSHLHFMAENQSAREFTVCDCVDEWRSPARNPEDVCTLSDLLEKHGLFIATADQQEKSAPVEAPVAWVVPGDHNARDNGFIDAMAWKEGEFTRPLYATPRPLPSLEALTLAIADADRRHPDQNKLSASFIAYLATAILTLLGGSAR